MLVENKAARAAVSPSQHDILRGSAEMARATGLPQRALDHLLARGRLQSPHKIGGRWFVSRSKLLREIVGD